MSKMKWSAVFVLVSIEKTFVSMVFPVLSWLSEIVSSSHWLLAFVKTCSKLHVLGGVDSWPSGQSPGRLVPFIPTLTPLHLIPTNLELIPNSSRRWRNVMPTSADVGTTLRQRLGMTAAQLDRIILLCVLAHLPSIDPSVSIPGRARGAGHVKSRTYPVWQSAKPRHDTPRHAIPCHTTPCHLILTKSPVFSALSHLWKVYFRGAICNFLMWSMYCVFLGIFMI